MRKDHLRYVAQVVRLQVQQSMQLRQIQEQWQQQMLLQLGLKIIYKKLKKVCYQIRNDCVKDEAVIKTSRENLLWDNPTAAAFNLSALIGVYLSVRRSLAVEAENELSELGNCHLQVRQNYFENHLRSHKQQDSSTKDFKSKFMIELFEFCLLTDFNQLIIYL